MFLLYDICCVEHTSRTRRTYWFASHDRSDRHRCRRRSCRCRCRWVIAIGRHRNRSSPPPSLCANRSAFTVHLAHDSWIIGVDNAKRRTRSHQAFTNTGIVETKIGQVVVCGVCESERMDWPTVISVFQNTGIHKHIGKKNVNRAVLLGHTVCDRSLWLFNSDSTFN